MSARRIHTLDVDSADDIAASYWLGSISQIVHELCINSLQASATKILLKINLENQCVQIHDNGCGFCRNAFESVGEKNVSSMPNLAPTSDFHMGRTLSSLKRCCDMKILVTYLRADGNPSAMWRTWKGSLLSDSNVDAQVPWGLSTPTTVILLKQIFQNLPVRKRQLLDNLTVNKECIVKVVTNLALLSSAVQWTIVDEASSRVLLQIVPQATWKARIKSVLGPEAENLLLLTNVQQSGAMTASGSQQGYSLTGFFSSFESLAFSNNFQHICM